MKPQLSNIYLLRDPSTGEPRYVGVTVLPIAKRLEAHLRESRRGVQTHKCNWIRSLLQAQRLPVVELIETTDCWQDRERFWIEHYRGKGSLTNLAEGGRGSRGYKLTPEQKAKQSAALRDKPKTPEHIAKIVAHHRGAKRSQATCDKLSARAKDRERSIESLQPLFEASRNKPRSEQHKANISAALRGRPATPTQLKNISVRHVKGIRLSDETKEKMSKAHEGVSRPTEVGRKISDGLREYWRKKKTDEHV